jgi:hypothetical protein
MLFSSVDPFSGLSRWLIEWREHGWLFLVHLSPAASVSASPFKNPTR